MNEGNYILVMIVSVLIGMLMAFGLVLLFTFYGSDDSCRSALYSALDI